MHFKKGAYIIFIYMLLRMDSSSQLHLKSSLFQIFVKLPLRYVDSTAMYNVRQDPELNFKTLYGEINSGTSVTLSVCKRSVIGKLKCFHHKRLWAKIEMCRMTHSLLLTHVPSLLCWILSKTSMFIIQEPINSHTVKIRQSAVGIKTFHQKCSLILWLEKNKWEINNHSFILWGLS